MSQHAPNWNLEDNTINYGHILPVETEENPLERAGDLANLLWQDGQYAAIQEQEPAAQECEQLLESIAVNLIQQQGSDTASWFENFPLEKVFCADFFPDMTGGGAGSGEAIPDMINANVGVAESGGAANAGPPPANPRDGDSVNEFRSDQIQKQADGSGGDDGGGVAGRRKEGEALWSAPLVSEPKHVPEATFAASGGGEQLGECSRGQKRKQIDLNGGEGKDAMEALDAKRSANRIRAAEVHNLTERRRRDRINEKMKALQGLIPNSNKTDKASLLDEAIEYLKALQLQVQIMWMRSTGMAQMMFPGVQLLQYDASGMGMGLAHLYQHQHQHHGVQIMHQNGGGSSSLASSSSPGNLFFNAPDAMNAVDLQSLQMERAPYFAFPHLPPPHPQMSNLCAFGSQILHQSQLAAVATSITLPTVDCDQNAHGTKPGAIHLLWRRGNPTPPRPSLMQK